MPKFDYDKDKVEALMMAVYMGLITAVSLPKELYFATANYLKSGVYKGYGGTITDFEFGSPDWELVNEFRTNTYIFSGAKVYQQMGALNSVVYEGSEKLSYKLFKEKALNIYKEYNTTWLETEFDTAVTSAHSGKQWKFIEKNKETFSTLRWNAIDGERTCEICGKLNGTTLPVSHPFWRTRFVPAHFKCHCVIESIDSYEDVTLTGQSKVDEITEQVDKHIQPAFRMNAGLDKYVFSPQHPYFKVEPKDKKLALKNFNLPIPKKDAD